MTEPATPRRPSAASFAADMASADGERIAAALHDLTRLPPPREALPPPLPDVLDAFPDGPPGEVVRDYVWVIGNWRPFDPPLSPEEVVRRWTEAVIRGGDGAAALAVVLYLRSSPRPAGTDVADVVRYVADRGVAPGRETAGAEYLARYLLDHSETYERAVAALPAWAGHPSLGAVVAKVAPYVAAADRPALGL